MHSFQFTPSTLPSIPSQLIRRSNLSQQRLPIRRKQPDSLTDTHALYCARFKKKKSTSRRLSFPQLIIAPFSCFMLKRVLATTTTAARGQLKSPTSFYITPAFILHHHTLIRAGVLGSMAHFASSDNGKDNDREHDNGDGEEDYIALGGSDPESDVEIDLVTKPQSSKALRKAPKVPKHFRKSNAKVYDNISVYAPPDSNLIFRCSQKRANWYLTRDLARQLSPTSIHLNFAPAGQGHVNDPYYLEERENKCVVCGKETVDAGATMLHVVPEQYRKWFPIRLKSHSSHDVVVSCPECNAQWDREAAVVRKKIVNVYGIPLEGVGWIRDHEAGVAKRSAGAVIAEWNRRWQESRDQQQRQQIGTKSNGNPIAPVIDTVEAKEENIHREPATMESLEQDSKGQKKAKVKKQNVIPAERLQVLEKNVYDWWTSVQGKVMDSSEESSSQQKRDLPSDFAKESLENDQESRKKLKADKTLSQAPTSSSSPSSSSSSETLISNNVGSMKQKEGGTSLKVPLPPPGHSSVVNRSMLEAALEAQANYKGEDYKEHGQLVVARVMARSREYHEDAEESEETILRWREAEPLKEGGQEGWRNIEEFIRTWRKEFLDRVRPKYLSTEWRVENAI